MKNLYILLFVSLAFIVHKATYASHVIGSEMTYKTTANPDVYRVQAKIYRDCSGIQMCANCPSQLSAACNINLTIKGATIPASSNIPANSCAEQSFGTQALTVVTSVSGFDVVQLCADQKTVCTNCGTRTPGTFLPGIEVYVFEGNINLASVPSTCCLVNIGYSSCCRNNANSTLVTPGSLNFYSQVTINRCANFNNAPVFTNSPVFIACAGQDFTANLGAIDPEGDSLSYGLGASMTGSNNIAPYVSPFSRTVPFPYQGYPAQYPPSDYPNGIHINPVTGDIRFRPMGTFVSNLVIEVKQWRRVGGVPTLMGISTRDVQFYSKPCESNSTPQMKVYSAQGTEIDSTSFAVCAGNTICFTIVAKDSAAAWDTTDLSWNAPDFLTQKGAVLTKLYNPNTRNVNGPKFDSAQFCWSPPVNAGSSYPYYFVLTAKDRTCPFPNSQTKSFSVMVQGQLEAIINKVNKNCGYYDFRFTQTNTFPLNYAATSFYIENEPRSNIYDTINGIQVSNHRFLSGGWHRVGLKLQGTTPNACNEYFWDSVLIQEPVKIGSVKKECVTNGVRVKASGKFGIPYGTTYRYTFYKGGFGSNQMIRPFGPDSNYTIPASFLAQDSLFYVVIQDLFGCKDSVEFSVKRDSFLASIPLVTYDFCDGVLDSIVVQDSSFNLHSYLWKSSNILTDSTSKRIMPSGAGWYFVEKTNANSCSVTDTILVRYSSPISLKLKVENNPNACEGNVKISSVFNPFYNYQWYLNNDNLVNHKNFDFLPENSGNYHVKIIDEGLCIRYSDTLFVPILPKPNVNPIMGKTVQLDTINVFTYFVFYQPNLRYEWYFFNAQALGKTDTTFVNVKFQNFGMARVLSKIVDTNNCERETLLELFVENTTGLNQIHNNPNFLIYPNPAKDVLHIELKNVLPSQMHHIRLFNKLGQTVYLATSAEKHLQIMLNNLPAESYYFVEISNENQERLATYKVFVEQ